jgi:hypothetical protein
MNPPSFNESILRKPETILKRIEEVESNSSLQEFHEIAQIARMCLGSSATNDYLEKLGAESIGARHLSDKNGPDGDLNGDGVEVKPVKKSPGVKSVACINDDTPMKLLKSHLNEKWLVLLCATETGTKVHYALCAPFHYWEQDRYEAILKRLNLTEESGWTWGFTLPSDLKTRRECLESLVTKHQAHTYVRSSSLSLDVVNTIPRNEISLWVHPDLPKKVLHPILQKLVSL